MLRRLIVDNFRALPHFEMEGLGRINLLVGTNNCGKTSVLEAVHLLSARGDPGAVWSSLTRRGERIWDNPEARSEAAVCHLFYGRELKPGSQLAVRGYNESAAESLTVMVVERQPPADVGVRDIGLEEDDIIDSSSPLALNLIWGDTSSLQRRLPLTRRGGLRANDVARFDRPQGEDRPIIHFITTEALTQSQVVSLYEAIVLTPEEAVLIEALRAIEPTIERIASVGVSARKSFEAIYSNERGGLVVRCSDSPQRIPIGSMGDGIWRMLGIALCLIQSRNGVLLVDEIDTGLHFSVMTRMWKLVCEIAKRLNVQVFATTHSRDCYESLAAISRRDVTEGSEVSIQRLERGRRRAVAFSEQEIVIAAERGIEVR